MESSRYSLIKKKEFFFSDIHTICIMFMEIISFILDLSTNQ